MNHNPAEADNIVEKLVHGFLISMRQLTNGFLLFLLAILVSCHSSDREKIRHLNTGFMGHGVELMNDVVCSFARDGDWIWIGYGFLGAGVTKYNIKTGKSLHFGNFIQENGVTYSVGGITNIAVTKTHVWLAGWRWCSPLFGSQNEQSDSTLLRGPWFAGIQNRLHDGDRRENLCGSDPVWVYSH